MQYWEIYRDTNIKYQAYNAGGCFYPLHVQGKYYK
jgi:hypothetical protein